MQNENKLLQNISIKTSVVEVLNLGEILEMLYINYSERS